MKAIDENEFVPTPDLLPFGGFNVAALLLKLKAGCAGRNDPENDTLSFEPAANDLSSGWQRSKLMCDLTRYI